MTARIPPGFAEVSVPFKHVNNSRSAYITFGVDRLASPEAGVDFANGIFTALASSLFVSIDSEVTCGPVYVLVGQDGPADSPYTGTLSQNGGRGLISTNSAVAVMFEKATDRPGRRGRGRFYVPWLLADTDVDEVGNVLPSFKVQLDLMGQAILDSLVVPALAAPMVLLHSPPIPAGVVPDPVVGLTCDPIIGIQRRRLNRGG